MAETKNAMNVHDQSQITSREEPLFVLKYRRRRVLLWLFIYFFYAFSFGLFAFVPLPAKDGIVLVLLAKFVFGLMSLYGLFQFIDLLLFKEILIYQDRIVKVWKCIGARGIKLSDAGLTIAIPSGRLGRTVYNLGTKRYLRGITCIFWLDDLACPKEVKKLNSLLAYLSGIKLKEIEYPVPLKKLIKEGDSPRSANGYTFNEDLLKEDPNEREYNRAVTISLIVWFLFVAVVLGVLCYFVVRHN
jgi:uncharacterized membrane protein